MKRTGTAILGTALILAMSVGASDNAKADSSVIEKAKQAGEIDVAIASLMPDSGLTSDGAVTGYVPEVTLAILKDFGIDKLNGSVAEFQAFIPGLQAGRWSLVTTGLTITPERCKVVAFSHPLGVFQEALVYPKGNPDHIASYKDIAANSKLRLAVLTGSTQEKYAIAQGVDSGQLERVSDQNGLVDSVLSGRANAFALGNIGLVGLLKPHADELESSVVKDGPKSATGVAFRKEDASFRDQFNEKLEKLRSTGELDRMFFKWYGEEDPGLAAATSLTEFASGCD
jgi:polar amino acid transport system substrate-binding protein